MRKKTSKKSEAPIAEVVEQVVEQPQPSTEAAVEKPKHRKMVEIHILASIMEFATEKAQLLLFHTDAGDEVKLWLSKSLANFFADGDNPEQIICQLPAWLYFKAGLNKFFPVKRWSQVAV